MFFNFNNFFCKKIIIFGFFVLFFSLFFVFSLNFVSATTFTGSGSGFSDIQTVIDSSSSGDFIDLGNVIYAPDSSTIYYC